MDGFEELGENVNGKPRRGSAPRSIMNQLIAHAAAADDDGCSYHDDRCKSRGHWVKGERDTNMEERAVTEGKNKKRRAKRCSEVRSHNHHIILTTKTAQHQVCVPSP